jgi:hypothetical protein
MQAPGTRNEERGTYPGARNLEEVGRCHHGGQGGAHCEAGVEAVADAARMLEAEERLCINACKCVCGYFESVSVSGIMLTAEAPALLISSCKADGLTPLILHGRHVWVASGIFGLGASYINASYAKVIGDAD